MEKKDFKKKKEKELRERVKKLVIPEVMDVFCGTWEDKEILDCEYNFFVLGREKFETMTYLREIFYGKMATTGDIQRIYTTT
jgi:hypothetical protein